jgi:demethylmenaquinone methyltransferase/2-methoxy-6-polyprenyl-1,4-benzoquinol methylase
VSAVTRRAAPLRIGNRLDAPDAKRALNERLFTAIASEYACMTAALSLGRDAAWKRDLVSGLPRLRAPVCVDLACGTGDVTRRLANRFSGGTVIGIDLTQAMLDRARRTTPQGNVRYARADMAATGLADGAVDIVTGAYALRNAPELASAAAEVARILRPGGHAAFLDFMRLPGRAAGAAELAVLKAWGGFWGLLLHGNADVYGYIAESVRRFPAPDALAGLFAARGLRVTRCTFRFSGFAGILFARKDIPGRPA